MTAIAKEDRTQMQRALAVMVGVTLIGLLAGTFFDEQLSTAIYIPNQPLAQLVSAIGLLPLSIPLCITLGALAQRVLQAKHAMVLKVVICVLLVALSCFTGFVTFKSFFAYDGIGPLLPFEVPTVLSAIVGILAALASMALGYAAAVNNREAELLRSLIITALLLVGSFLLVEIFKGIMHRPRPRAIALGYEGLDFQPWYRPFTQWSEIMSKYGLDSDSFKSFPSGHSVQAGATLVSFYGLAALFPALRRKCHVALFAQIILFVFVLASRMVLGAHFLSDVSVGAFISLLAGVFVYEGRVLR